MAELTPKGKCFLQYLKDKILGKNVFIQEYEDEIKQLEQNFINRAKDAEHQYIESNIRKNQFPRYIKGKVKKNYPFLDVEKGEIVELYDIPYRKNLKNLINLIENFVELVNQVGFIRYFKEILKQINFKLFDKYYHGVGESFPFIFNEHDIDIIEE